MDGQGDVKNKTAIISERRLDPKGSASGSASNDGHPPVSDGAGSSATDDSTETSGRGAPALPQSADL